MLKYGEKAAGKEKMKLKLGKIMETTTQAAFGDPVGSDTKVTACIYNDLDELFGANVRFNWIYRPGADLFVVYNHNWDAPSFTSRVTRVQQLIVKFTYLFQL